MAGLVCAPQAVVDQVALSVGAAAATDGLEAVIASLEQPLLALLALRNQPTVAKVGLAEQRRQLQQHSDDCGAHDSGGLYAPYTLGITLLAAAAAEPGNTGIHAIGACLPAVEIVAVGQAAGTPWCRGWQPRSGASWHPDSSARDAEVQLITAVAGLAGGSEWLAKVGPGLLERAFKLVDDRSIHIAASARQLIATLVTQSWPVSDSIVAAAHAIWQPSSRCSAKECVLALFEDLVARPISSGADAGAQASARLEALARLGFWNAIGSALRGSDRGLLHRAISVVGLLADSTLPAWPSALPSGHSGGAVPPHELLLLLLTNLLGDTPPKRTRVAAGLALAATLALANPECSSGKVALPAGWQYAMALVCTVPLGLSSTKLRTGAEVLPQCPVWAELWAKLQTQVFGPEGLALALVEAERMLGGSNRAPTAWLRPDLSAAMLDRAHVLAQVQTASAFPFHQSQYVVRLLVTLTLLPEHIQTYALRGVELLTVIVERPPMYYRQSCTHTLISAALNGIADICNAVGPFTVESAAQWAGQIRGVLQVVARRALDLRWEVREGTVAFVSRLIERVTALDGSTKSAALISPTEMLLQENALFHVLWQCLEDETGSVRAAAIKALAAAVAAAPDSLGFRLPEAVHSACNPSCAVVSKVCALAQDSDAVVRRAVVALLDRVLATGLRHPTSFAAKQLQLGQSIKHEAADCLSHAAADLDWVVKLGALAVVARCIDVAVDALATVERGWPARAAIAVLDVIGAGKLVRAALEDHDRLVKVRATELCRLIDSRASNALALVASAGLAELRAHLSTIDLEEIARKAHDERVTTDLPWDDLCPIARVTGNSDQGDAEVLDPNRIECYG